MFKILQNKIYKTLYFYEIKKNRPIFILAILSISSLFLFINTYYFNINAIQPNSSSFGKFISFNISCIFAFTYIFIQYLYDRPLIRQIKNKENKDQLLNNSDLMRFLESGNNESVDLSFLESHIFKNFLFENINKINHQNKNKETFLHILLKRKDNPNQYINELILSILKHEHVDVFICDAQNQPVYNYLSYEQQAFVSQMHKTHILKGIKPLPDTSFNKIRI